MDSAGELTHPTRLGHRPESGDCLESLGRFGEGPQYDPQQGSTRQARARSVSGLSGFDGCLGLHAAVLMFRRTMNRDPACQ